MSKCKPNASKSKNKTSARLSQNERTPFHNQNKQSQFLLRTWKCKQTNFQKKIIENFEEVSKKFVRKWFCWNVAIFWWEVGRRPVFSSVDISASGESQSQRREHKSLLTKTESSLQDKFQEFTSEDKIREEEWSKITWNQLKWSEI